MAGNASWNATTNTLTYSWSFPSGAAALRALDEALIDLGVDIEAMTTAQKVVRLRQEMAGWWKGHVASYETRRDVGTAATTATQNVETQVDLS